MLSGWLRAAASEDIALGVKSNGTTEAFQRLSGSVYGPATVTFTTGTNVSSATVYCFKNGGSTTGAYDDIKLTKLG